MIQDIGYGRLDNQYGSQKAPCALDYILVFKGKEVFLKNEDGNITFLSLEIIEQLYSNQKREMPELIYLFALDGRSVFLLEDEAWIEQQMNELPGFAFHKMHDTRRMQPKEFVMVAATGIHLYAWYHANHFCGCCGTKLTHDSKIRMLHCSQCNNMVFPKIAPAVIVGVTDGDRIMLTKYAGREYTRYALIAGFVEIGETVEETVKREVLEEVGVHVKNIKYYKSQPWGFDSDLLLGYFCELDGDGIVTMDQEELSVAEWVHYKDMPEYHEGLSLTEEMMNTYKHQREELHAGD